LQVSAIGGIGNKGFTWNTGDNSSLLINQLAGIYTVITEDQIGCKDTLSIELTQPALLETSTSSSMVICFGSATGQASVVATGGTAPYTYYWDQNQIQQSFLSQVVAGLYTVSVTDVNGCSINDTAIISQPTALQLDITSSPALCYGQASGTASAVISGGVPPYNLGWNNGVSSNFIDQLIAGNYNIVATDANGCSISQGVEVAQPLPLNGIISGDVAACKGESIQLVVSGEGGTYPYTFLWENGDSNTNTTFTPDSSGFFTVITTDSNGCLDTSSRQFRIFELPELSIISPDTALCAGQCINLKVADVDGGQYVWSFLNNGNIFGQTAQFCSSTVGSYDIHVEVTDINTCFNSLDLPGFIQVNPNPIVDFEPDKRTVPLLDALIKFDNNSIGATTYLWDLNPDISGDETTLVNPIHQYVEVGAYEITLIGTNDFGCSATISRFVEVLEDFAVYFPNAFTPNGDGLNDTFQPSGIGIDPSDYFMQIYDRWGKLVFETDEWSKGWDGKIENKYGESEQSGNVYVYKMRIKDFRGDYHKFNGTATLVR
jgi:gliding motility-associated-like protein